MRDRLIELLKNDYCPSPMLCDDKCKYINSKNCYAERIADMLLANGVIVPPCKVGDKVYLPCLNDWGDIENYTITDFVLDDDGLCFVVDDENREAHSIEILGKEVFLTEKEAKKHLQEGVQG